MQLEGGRERERETERERVHDRRISNGVIATQKRTFKLAKWERGKKVFDK